MESCNWCNTPYTKGTVIDVGIGAIQVSANEPNCTCYDTLRCCTCGTSQYSYSVEVNEGHCKYCGGDLFE